MVGSSREWLGVVGSEILFLSRECSSLHVTCSTLALEEGGAQRKKILSLSLKENARVFNEKIFSSTPHPLKMKSEHVNM